MPQGTAPLPGRGLSEISDKGEPAIGVFVMLTRLEPDAVRSPQGLERLEREVMKHVRADCPKVEWLGSYAVLGPCDYLDIFRAKDTETAMRVSALVRSFGHAKTEVWSATEWEDFKAMMRGIKAKALK